MPRPLLAVQPLSPTGSIVVGLILIVVAPLLHTRVLPYMHKSFDQIHKVRRSDGARFMQEVVGPIFVGVVGVILLVVGLVRLF